MRVVVGPDHHELLGLLSAVAAFGLASATSAVPEAPVDPASWDSLLDEAARQRPAYLRALILPSRKYATARRVTGRPAEWRRGGAELWSSVRPRP